MSDFERIFTAMFRIYPIICFHMPVQIFITFSDSFLYVLIEIASNDIFIYEHGQLTLHWYGSACVKIFIATRSVLYQKTSK